jgi:hypothetical protein
MREIRTQALIKQASNQRHFEEEAVHMHNQNTSRPLEATLQKGDDGPSNGDFLPQIKETKSP